MQVGYLDRRQALITVDNRLVVIGYGAAKLREEMLQALIGLHPCLVLTGLTSASRVVDPWRRPALADCKLIWWIKRIWWIKWIYGGIHKNILSAAHF